MCPDPLTSHRNKQGSKRSPRDYGVNDKWCHEILRLNLIQLTLCKPLECTVPSRMTFLWTKLQKQVHVSQYRFTLRLLLFLAISLQSSMQGQFPHVTSKPKFLLEIQIHISISVRCISSKIPTTPQVNISPPPLITFFLVLLSLGFCVLSRYIYILSFSVTCPE